MWLIEDTRQQEGKHRIKHEWWKDNDVHLYRCKLPVGDYTIIGSTIYVDTKANVEEIAANIGGKEHIRFREECKLAKELGASLIILVENKLGYTSVQDVTSWVNPNRNKTAKSINGPRLAKAMATMSERYGVRFEFCSPADAGRRVIELLEAKDG